jgi:hypothetical protein
LEIVYVPNNHNRDVAPREEGRVGKEESYRVALQELKYTIQVSVQFLLEWRRKIDSVKFSLFGSDTKRLRF